MERNIGVHSGIGEGFRSKEMGIKSSVGVAVLIVGYDPSRNGENETDPFLWTTIEKTSKIETDKIAGQISLPAETRKNGENLENNVFGALGEFCDDNAFTYVKNHIVKPSSIWYIKKGITVLGNPVDVAVLIYDGALDFPLSPAHLDEINPNGWMKKSDLRKELKLRSVFTQALELDDKEGLTRKALESYRSSPRALIFPDGFDSIQKFNNSREFGIDVKVLSPYERELSEKFPEIRKYIIDTINLLIESQRSEGARDFQKEDELVSRLKEYVDGFSHECVEVGIGRVSGEEFKTIRAILTRDAKKHWGLFKKLETTWTHTSPQQITDASVKGWGYWSLVRGDRLNHFGELDNEWYLKFNVNLDNSTGNDSCIIPINRIKDLQLRPHNTGF